MSETKMTESSNEVTINNDQAILARVADKIAEALRGDEKPVFLQPFIHHAQDGSLRPSVRLIIKDEQEQA